MEELESINAGGVNGLGVSKADSSSISFKALQCMIKNHYDSQSFAVIMENGLLSVKFRMESLDKNAKRGYCSIYIV